MVQEAKFAGLRLKDHLEARELTQRYFGHLETPPKSIRVEGLWNVLELLPFKHFTYKDSTSKTWCVSTVPSAVDFVDLSETGSRICIKGESFGPTNSFTPLSAFSPIIIPRHT